MQDLATANGGDARLLRTAIRIAALALLGVGVWIILTPLLTVLCWAAILSTALYPLYHRASGYLGSAAASAAVALVLLLLALGPMALLGISFLRGVASVAPALDGQKILIPPPPQSVENLPIIGEAVARTWRLAAENVQEAIRQHAALLKSVAYWTVGWAQAILTGFLQFLASIVVAGFLLPCAQHVSARVRNGMEELLGERAEEVLQLVVGSVRSVARGVIGVSLLQSTLAGLGFFVAGIPQPGLLAFAMLILSIVQLGSVAVLLPVTIWVWLHQDAGSATLFTIYAVFVGSIDNVLRAYYFSKDVPVPAAVIIAGALGGALSLGLIGLFLGPVVLCVVWNLLTTFTSGDPVGAPQLLEDDLASVSRLDIHHANDDRPPRGE